MPNALQSLVDTGTRMWLDSVDPQEVIDNKALGITGATSNPAIIQGLIQTGRFDDDMQAFLDAGHDDEAIAWAMTDKLVGDAQEHFKDVWQSTAGNDGWVSFELDPLLEDPDNTMSVAEKARHYVDLGKRWAEGHPNRMIKVPATPGGLAALEDLAAAGLTLNVTLIFTQRQYEAARDAVWKGRQRFGQLDKFKSVYSIFISRVDVYTKEHCPGLSEEAQGLMGIVNAKRIGIENAKFWADKGLPLQQEMIFASTGAKLDWQAEDYYVAAMAGSDIQTNPPETNAAVLEMGKAYSAKSRELPDQAVLDDLDAKVDPQHMEDTLMSEGTAKFAVPHKKLLAAIADKRKALAGA
ncbi:MAG: transaldolase family protein [Planctomycetota bacterium]